jgi:guanine nucleotide-binding protein G(i) subunit alpha
MLEKTSTRKIFKRVKDDTSSLYIQRDSTSFYSRYTDNLSKISKMFEFDRELFISKVYEKALRGSLKDTVENMRREQQKPYLGTWEERNRNMLIERDLEERARKLRSECKVLLLGDRDCGQIFIKSMRVAHSGGFTYEEREEYQEVAMNNIIRVMEGMALILQNGDIDLDETAKMHAEVLSQEIEKIKTGNGKITTEGARAVQGLWKNERFAERLLNNEVDMPDSSP